MTATVFLPAVGAVAILLLVRGDRNIRLFAVMVALADLVLALLVFSLFDSGEGSDIGSAPAQFFAWSRVADCGTLRRT